MNTGYKVSLHGMTQNNALSMAGFKDLIMRIMAADMSYYGGISRNPECPKSIKILILLLGVDSGAFWYFRFGSSRFILYHTKLK